MNERTETPMSLSLRHLILSLILLFSAGVLRAQCEGKSGIALIICNGAQRIPGGAAAGPLAPFVQYLLDEQPVTTSFHNTRPADPTARYLAPANYAPLSTLPRTAEGAFLLRPGAYEGYLQSYCLKAGTYGPSQGDGYLAAPLTGPKAAIVRTILKQAPRHPEVRQQDIQQLLWAIIAKVDYRQMPQEMHRTAAALLPPRELEQLRGGIISRLPDAFRQPLEQHIQRRLAVVQGPLRQVLNAENNLRNQIATRASFDVMARTAVLAGAAPADPTMPPVPRGTWIQNRQGFYLRYLPDSYSRTKVQLVVPETTPMATADPLIFDPTEELAVPANTAGQRLGLTAREEDTQRLICPLPPDSPYFTGVTVYSCNGHSSIKVDTTAGPVTFGFGPKPFPLVSGTTLQAVVYEVPGQIDKGTPETSEGYARVKGCRIMYGYAFSKEHGDKVAARLTKAMQNPPDYSVVVTNCQQFACFAATLNATGSSFPLRCILPLDLGDLFE